MKLEHLIKEHLMEIKVRKYRAGNYCEGSEWRK